MVKKLLILLMVTAYSSVWAGQDSVYDFLWLDPDKKVYVLQNKEFTKAGRAYFEVNGIINQTSIFQDTMGAQGKFGYNFTEEWGIEGFYNAYFHSDNENIDNVKLLNSGEPFVRRINNAYGLNVVWSPFFGKINTFNKIIYFDWSFAAGPAWFATESNLETVFDDSVPNSFTDESAFGFNLKTSVKFYLSQSFYINVEIYRLNFFVKTPEDPSSKSLQNETEIALGVGWSF